MRNFFKHIIFLVLILSVFAQTIRVPLIYAWYYSNIAQITNEHCENKNIPMTQCLGQCYVQEVVEKTSGQTDNSQLPNTDTKYRKITLFLTTLSFKVDPIKVEKPNGITSCICFYSYTAIFSVFHPPQS